MRRRLAILVTPAVVVAAMAGLAQAASAAPVSRGAAGTHMAPAGLAAAPASLQAAIRTSLGGRQAGLTASDAAKGNLFGWSVALSSRGAVALVGAINRNSGAGAAYVFTRQGGAWTQAAKLTASGARQNDDFGWSVSLSGAGTTALIGAFGRDGLRGAAYVFTLRGGTWSQAAELTASGGKVANLFGASVALSTQGTVALVGAPGNHGSAGAAYVFRPQGGKWTQAAKLTASDATQAGLFGNSVALSALGTRALIGAPGQDSNTGAAYVFTPQGGKWSQAAELTASDAASGGAFGNSVALSALGTRALIGAPGTNSNAGAGYVFSSLGGSWSQAAELTASHPASRDELGVSVALSAPGTMALVGAPGRAAVSGAAYVFTPRGGKWSQAAELTASGAAAGSEFGWSVALSALGTTALAGSPQRHSDTGAAYAFGG